MNVIRWGANAIEGVSPTSVLLAGTALALTFPPVRSSLRFAAVMATRGVLTVADTLQNTVTTLRDGMDTIVAEAKIPTKKSPSNIIGDECTIAKAVKKQGRRLATSAVSGVLNVSGELQNIVEEARGKQESAIQASDMVEIKQANNKDQTGVQETFDAPAVMQAPATEINDPETSEADLEHDSPRKKHSRSK